MRATWLTDIHLNFMRPLALRAFYARVQQDRPDALFVTGDIGESDSVARFVGELGALAPVYYVLGNHDYYRSSIHAVRDHLPAGWLPALGPVHVGNAVVIGVDGWGDARCGDLRSTVQLSDWQLIEELAAVRYDRPARIQLLQELGTAEAFVLGELLARVPPQTERLIVLTHVPPFPEACVYDGAQSEPAWLPWFTCVATGEVLAEYARAYPDRQITVLCGHSHGIGSCRPVPNLEVRTGGWPPGVEGYGNPIVQATLEL